MGFVNNLLQCHAFMRPSETSAPPVPLLLDFFHLRQHSFPSPCVRGEPTGSLGGGNDAASPSAYAAATGLSVHRTPQRDCSSRPLPDRPADFGVLRPALPWRHCQGCEREAEWSVRSAWRCAWRCCCAALWVRHWTQEIWHHVRVLRLEAGGVGGVARAPCLPLPTCMLPSCVPTTPLIDPTHNGGPTHVCPAGHRTHCLQCHLPPPPLTASISPLLPRAAFVVPTLGGTLAVPGPGAQNLPLIVFGYDPKDPFSRQGAQPGRCAACSDHTPRPLVCALQRPHRRAPSGLRARQAPCSCAASAPMRVRGRGPAPYVLPH